MLPTVCPGLQKTDWFGLGCGYTLRSSILANSQVACDYYGAGI